MSYHGKPVWFELSTPTGGGFARAEAFYGGLFGWTFQSAGMDGFDYHLASSGSDMVAGLMELDTAERPPSWLIYIAADDTDAAAASTKAKGGQVLMEPADIPGTGRFAVLTDPQGAPFGVLQPSPMDPPPPEDSGAWNQKKTGHGNWIELMSTDPVAGLAFYSDLFGWTKSTAIDMGEMGTYQMFNHDGAEIGGMMGLGNAPVPCWLPYFGVDSTTDAIERIKSLGGTVIHGPTEVPGPAYIAIAHDPDGAYFAVVGPK